MFQKKGVTSADIRKAQGNQKNESGYSKITYPKEPALESPAD